jgi:hypothetical protein
VNTAKNASQIQEHFSNFKNEISSIFNKKDQLIENLLINSKHLDETNIQLKKKVMAYEEENNKGKFCIHCHKMFVPKFNEEVNLIEFIVLIKIYRVHVFTTPAN